MTEQPTLKTDRLILRPFTPADAPAVQRLAAAFAVADTTLNIPHPYPEGTAVQWIDTHRDHFIAGSAAIFAIVIRETGEVAGAISLGISQRHRRAEMGYWLGVAYWKQGYMTEAATAILTYGFTALDLHRIYARHFTRNPASGRVLQKLGMRYEGTQREHVQKGEGFEDLANYGILRREWRAKAEGGEKIAGNGNGQHHSPR